MWSTSKILAILDHHVDRGLALDASPRIIDLTASCASIVGQLFLPLNDSLRNVPTELIDLLLRAIALDSSGLKGSKTTEVDRSTARGLFIASSWASSPLKDVLQDLSREMGEQKEDLSRLSVRDLLRRDWKGDV